MFPYFNAKNDRLTPHTIRNGIELKKNKSKKKTLFFFSIKRIVIDIVQWISLTIKCVFCVRD